ncbi:MAG: penicillin-binding transpeptidase domain-containing protein [Deltaproteobacteria bacterium]|nr:penicillin-binding transpeptidase domain-containing protein [Deltaproteobacteria bacterium]
MRRKKPISKPLRAARERKDAFRTRTMVVRALFLLFIAALVGRAFQLQVLQHQDWDAKARSTQTDKIKLTPKRGAIFDRNGDVLAFSIDVDSIYADPKLIHDPDETAQKLAAALGVDEKRIAARLSRSGSRFAWIKRRVTPEESDRLFAEKIKGVSRLKESARRYPHGPLAAPILGLTEYESGKGLAGLERKYNKYLKGGEGYLLGMRDARGRSFFPDGVKYVNSEPGGTVRLTIDAQIQHYAEQELDAGLARIPAKRAMAVVMNPMTGEVLALAQRPSFDPNERSRFDQDLITNHVVIDTFEPGSVMKPFVVAAALDAGLVTPDEPITCEMGKLRIGNHVIHDVHSYGALPVSMVVAKSSNIGTAKIGMRLGADGLYTWLAKFGFGRKSDFDFPGELSGTLRPASQWSRVGLANIAFGQGVTVNAVQMTAAFSTLVNGGALVRPYLVSDVRDRHGRVVVKNNPQIVPNVIRGETSKTMREILALVTKPGGTGTAAAVPNYSVAGKTGTAEKVDPKTRTYSSSARIGGFIGALPAENPRLAIYVIVDEPQGPQNLKYGGVCAAPIFRAIAARAISYLEGGSAEPLEEIPLGRVLQMALAEPPKEQPVEERVQDERLAPNMVGLPVRDAIQLASRRNVRLIVVGSGIAVRQEPGPGLALGNERYVKVEFVPAG